MSGGGAIRGAVAADAGAIASLWTEAYVAEGEGGRALPYSAADFHETVARARVFVAEREGAIAGVVALFAPGAEGRAVALDEEAELSRLVVAASARRLGLGSALATHCEGIARAEGWSAIALWSRRYQRAAHRLYEALGYRRAPQRDTVDESDHERLVFRLEL